MIFTSISYAIFLAFIFSSYWLIRKKSLQNILLLVASYYFYGFIHPWFCILIASSTIVDYLCGLGMQRKPDRKKVFLIISLLFNLGLLGFFKYFNFFADNVHQLLETFGLNVNEFSLKIFLPVGISFYTFQTLSYTIDIYRGKLEARTNFIDFSVFVAFFPQLVAGPIERASRLLPQVESQRNWNSSLFFSAFPLLIRGFFKKLVIADNVAIYADKIFMLESPSFILLLAGGFAFAIQIFADFSAYTDIARASARLLGFELMENFNMPYIAISPSDFWRRWHISFSSWIRDYLYIPLGGSKVNSKIKFFFILLTSLGLSGLWHGASWNFVVWGIYHAIILFIYHQLGFSGQWKPKTKVGLALAWLTMSFFTLGGWLIFRTTSLSWLVRNLTVDFSWGFNVDHFVVAQVIVFTILFFCIPLLFLYLLEKYLPKLTFLHSAVYAISFIATLIFFRANPQDFIYFQF